jgi:hypothetical protein
MKSLYLGGVCAAAVFAFGMAAFAQSTAAQQTTTDQQVTLMGCIQREADYRRGQAAGRGGVAGTGVGVANEFVLANASMGTATGATGTTGAAPGSTTATAGTATTMTAYELTGTNEGQAARYVGQRVEISGKLKAAAVAPSGRPTGGATAGKPPEGIEIAGQDLQLREVEVASIRKVSGTCPAP